MCVVVSGRPAKGPALCESMCVTSGRPTRGPALCKAMCVVVRCGPASGSALLCESTRHDWPSRERVGAVRVDVCCRERPSRERVGAVRVDMCCRERPSGVRASVA